MKKKCVFGDPLYWHDEIVRQLQSVPQLGPHLLKEGGELMVEGVRGSLVLTVGDIHQQLLLVGDDDIPQLG